MTILVRDPSLREPSEDEAEHVCGGGGYFCLVHGQAYAYEQCGPGRHEIRWECNVHGPEAYGWDQLMVWKPNGFDPPLTEAQLHELLGE